MSSCLFVIPFYSFIATVVLVCTDIMNSKLTDYCCLFKHETPRNPTLIALIKSLRFIKITKMISYLNLHMVIEANDITRGSVR